ncbi:MAG: hypothetical protein LUQ29_11505 [Methylococcaceae bacterium]|jgi:hypothetical protein|nr:hypothetical protein [Methylococcaceae bacterium]
MIIKNRFSPFFKPLALAVVLAMAPGAHGAGTAEGDAVLDPWAFNLTLYMWFPGVNGDFSAGPLNRSVDLSFIDIADKMSSFPMAFNGHFEAHYERLGFYLDGNYMGMDFEPRFDRVSEGSSMELGIMDYGVSYRLFGSTASESVSHWEEKARSNILDIYAGGRTIWLGTQVDSKNNGSASADTSSTAPVIGGRIVAEFLPKWFLLLDGNAGGFGADNVSFTGAALGAVGYRATLFGVPSTVEAGYKALNVDVDKGRAAADVTMHGPFIGLTGYW